MPQVIGDPPAEKLLRVTAQGGTMITTTNNHFYEAGIFQDTFDHLIAEHKITDFVSEYGDHILGKNIGGWVSASRKR